MLVMFSCSRGVIRAHLSGPWPFLAIVLSVVFVACLYGADAPDQSVSAQRTLVIIVPGTTGNSAFWPVVVADRSTFASELRSALGDGVTVYPYLWDGDNDNRSRQKAAVDLATLIDRR